ncbi:MAG: tripartite tricarboxylate transporter substrate binding protein [Spirochaetia bacterium]|jgi:tripartite-type tricarboxylate transporter receptor subunit TctC|nr:tripartite tricarboxylate transporter substrate binding protein [Spirochaetia bacterium]
MKKFNIVLLILLMSAAMVFAGGGQEEKAGAAKSAFPEKPIKLVVYLAPGGSGDILARKFTDIASKYTDTTFVVENKPGAGGIVTLEYIRNLPADGYNLMYVTKSIVSKVATTDTDIDLTKEFDWISMLQIDPECVITNAKSKVHTWEQVFADAKAKNGNQLWLGPAAGGLDHVTAQKIWASAGMQAKWVPYDSGAKAIAGLLGQQGIVYVGNPAEVKGKPDLKVAAICYSERLPEFKDVPTFKELGIEGVENEIMWRGFAVKAGTPDNVIAWYDDLFTKVSNDADWKKTYESDGIAVVDWKKDKFNKLVADDLAEAKASAK